MAENYTGLVSAKTPAAPGHVNYGIPVEYIPRLYAAKVLVKYYAKTVLTSIANTDYEGQIKNMGDTVVIRTRPDVQINDYYKGKKLSYEQLSSPAIQLDIDRAKDYAFEIDDIDAKQADIALSEQFLTDAAEQMAIAIDTDVLDEIFLDVDPANQGLTAGKISQRHDLGTPGTPLVLTKSNILDTIISMKVVLNEQNVPMSGRWAVFPADVCGLIDRSDIGAADYSGDQRTLMYNKGWVGNVAGFDIFDSNLLNTADESGDVAYNICFGQRDSLTYAAQLVKNDSVKLQETFGRGYRGLQVYGFLVQKPNGMGRVYATTATP